MSCAELQLNHSIHISNYPHLFHPTFSHDTTRCVTFIVSLFIGCFTQQFGGLFIGFTSQSTESIMLAAARRNCGRCVPRIRTRTGIIHGRGPAIWSTARDGIRLPMGFYVERKHPEHPRPRELGREAQSIASTLILYSLTSIISYFKSPCSFLN